MRNPVDIRRFVLALGALCVLSGSVHFALAGVSRVRYRTEDTRVGEVTYYDRLILEIWTNGTTAPEMALVEAAKILRKHLNPFIQYDDIGFQLQKDNGLSIEEREEAGNVEEIQRKLGLPISALALSVRARNCLEAENIKTIRELISSTPEEMIKVRNFGKTPLMEVRKKLGELGLSLGLDLSKIQDGKVNVE